MGSERRTNRLLNGKKKVMLVQKRQHSLRIRTARLDEWQSWTRIFFQASYQFFAHIDVSGGFQLKKKVSAN